MATDEVRARTAVVIKVREARMFEVGREVR